MKILFLALLLTCNLILYAQQTSAGMNGTQRRMEVYSWAERPEEKEEYDLQKMFLDHQWMLFQICIHLLILEPTVFRAEGNVRRVRKRVLRRLGSLPSGQKRVFRT